MDNILVLACLIIPHHYLQQLGDRQHPALVEIVTWLQLHLQLHLVLQLQLSCTW